MLAQGEAIKNEGKFAERTAVVVDNNDPLKLQRVRVAAEGVYESKDVNNLPWVLPETSQGGRPDNASIDVPPIGSELKLTFPDSNRYSAYYKNAAATTTNHPHSVLTSKDYPNVYGFVKGRDWFRASTLGKWWQWFRAAKHFIDIDESGAVTINLPHNVFIRVQGTTQLQLDKLDLVSTDTRIEHGSTEVTTGGWKHRSGSFIQNKPTAVGAVTHQPPDLSARVAALEAQLAQLTTQSEQLNVEAKLYNQALVAKKIPGEYD